MPGQPARAASVPESEQRRQAHQIVSRLAPDEKAALLSGADAWHTVGLGRLDVASVTLADGPAGLRKVADPEVGVMRFDNAVRATAFPVPAALGNSFDPDVVAMVGRAIGEEAREQSVGVVLGPGINIKRSPLGGRNFEYYSEDPILSGQLGAAWVQGLQSCGVGACVKHFAANNQETRRMTADALIDEQTLYEVYLRAFEHVVRTADPWTLMCAYNRVNGTYCSESHWLLTELLRDQWGFDGLVVSDWGAVLDRVRSLAAGVDLAMPPDLAHDAADIQSAIARGMLSPQGRDEACARVVELALKVTQDTTRELGRRVGAHHHVAREAAGRSIVLLRNRAVDANNHGSANPVLPLAHGAKLAVIGEFAANPRFRGGGSSQVIPMLLDIPLDEIRGRADEPVRYEAGFLLSGESDDELADRAVEAAEEAEVAVVFVGLPDDAESEGLDRTSILLPAVQTGLVQRIAAANPRTVVVLTNGGVVQLAEWSSEVPALVEASLLGEAGGSAIADMLFGEVNPSGRLAETIPLRLQDTAAYFNFPGDRNQVRYAEGLHVGYKWYNASQLEVAYPFGHGLSYTRFSYNGLHLAADESGLHARFTLRNTGARVGREIPQLYVALRTSAYRRAGFEFKASAVGQLAPGEQREVTLSVPPADLGVWDADLHRWLVEGGDYDVAVGASSRDIRLNGIVTVRGEARPRTLDRDSTVSEWLSSPLMAQFLAVQLANLATDPGAASDGAGPRDPQEFMSLAHDLRLSQLPVLAPQLHISREQIDQLIAAAGMDARPRPRRIDDSDVEGPDVSPR